MSTRATIIIRQKDVDDESKYNEIRLYHHSDGYPDGIGADLKDYLKNHNDCADPKFGVIWDGEIIATELVRGKCMTNEYTDGSGRTFPDMGYECALCQHGDEEFGYIIDCDERTIKCYGLDMDQFDWTGAREYSIPDKPYPTEDKQADDKPKEE